MAYNQLQSLPKEQIILSIKEPNPVRKCENENIFSLFCSRTGTFLQKVCLREPVGTVTSDDDLLMVCLTLHHIH